MSGTLTVFLNNEMHDLSKFEGLDNFEFLKKCALTRDIHSIEDYSNGTSRDGKYFKFKVKGVSPGQCLFVGQDTENNCNIIEIVNNY